MSTLAKILLAAFAVLVLMLAVALSIRWHNSVGQSMAWKEDEGVDVSPWDIFTGNEPQDVVIIHGRDGVQVNWR